MQTDDLDLEPGTELGWDQRQLLGFFQRAGFTLAPRLCLEKRFQG